MNPKLAVGHLLLVLCFLGTTSNISAATATKQASGTDLTGVTVGVWSGGSGANGAPTSADTATWTSTSLGSGLTLGTSATWGAMTVSGAAGAIDISGAGTLTLGTTASQTTVFTIASTGQNVTFNNPVKGASSGSASGGASFSVTSGKTLTFNSSIGADAASHQVTFTGGGTVYLNGTDTFTSGGVSITGGATVSVGNMANAFSGATFLQMAGSGGNATLVYTGSGENFPSVPIRYTSTSASKTQIIDQSGSSGILTFPGDGTYAFNATANGAHTIQLQGSTAGAGVISGVINNNGTVNVVKTGSGTWTLSGNNTFAGGVSLNQGQLNINHANALGTAAGTFNISGSAGAVSIDNTSAGSITLANYPQTWGADFTFVGTKDLNLGAGAVTMSASRQVVVSAGTLTVGGVIGGSSLGLTKTGSGTLALTGANGYTGATTVRNGTLTIGSGGSLNASSAVEVSAADGNANLSGVGTINGGVTLDASGTFNAGINLQDGSAGTLTLAGGLTLNSGNILNFDFLSGAADKVAMTGGIYTKNSGDVNINILVAATGLAVGTYDLITASGLNATNGFVLGTVPSNTSYKYSLTATTGKLQLKVENNTSTPSVAYWKGGVDGNWSTADSGGNFNWASDSTGATTAGGAPGLGITAVTFSANSPANESTTLGANFDTLSLAFTSGNAVTIAGANTLTVENGITKSGSGTATISANTLALGGDQTLANNSSTALNISSSISGAHTLTVNSSGSGITTLSGANSHSGTTLQNGNLTLSGSGTLGGSSAGVSVTGGILDLGATSQTTGGTTISGGTVQNGSITGTSFALQAGMVSVALNGSGAALTKSTVGSATLTGNNGYTGGTTISGGTLTIGGAGQLGGGTYSGTISDSGALNFNSSANQTLMGVVSGSGTLTQAGSGTLTLSAANTYAGNTTISSGTLKFGVANAIPSGASAGNVIVNGTLDLSGFNDAINGFSGSGIVDNTAGSAATLQVGNNNQSGTFGGSIQNSGGGALNLQKTGTGMLNLTGTNSFSGFAQVLGGGTLNISSLSSALGGVSSIILGGGSAGGTLLYTGTGEISDRIISYTATQGSSYQPNEPR